MSRELVKSVVVLGILATLAFGWCSVADAQEEVAKFEEEFPPVKGLWPLVWSERREDRRQDEILWPFYEYERRPDGYKYRALRPLFTWNKDPKNELSSWSLLWPLLTQKREGDESRFAFRPFLWHMSSPEYSRTVIPPVLWHYWKKDWSVTLMPPLFWRWRNGDSTTAIAPPLFWSFRKGDNIATTLFPVFWHFKQPDKSATVLFPLAWNFSDSKKSETYILPSFYRRREPDRSITACLPLFYHDKETSGAHSTYIFPNIYSEHDEKGDGLTTLFPVYWRGRREGSTSTVLFPFLYERHGGKAEPYAVVFPLYWEVPDGSGGRVDSLLPVYYRRRYAEPSHVDTAVFPLLLWYSRRNDTSLTLSPLYINRTEGDRSYTFVPPTFYRQSNGDRSFSVLLPALWNWADKDTSTTFALPGFYRRASKGKDNVTCLFPLFNYRYSREKDSESTRLSILGTPLLPIFSYKSDARETGHYLFPLYSYTHRKNSRAFKPIDVVALFRYDSTKDNLSYRLPFYSFHYRSDSKGNYRWGVFGRLVWKEKKGGDRTFEINPFFQHYKRGNNYSNRILGGLIRWGKVNGKTYLGGLWVF